MNVASKVPPPYNGMSLADYLAKRFTYLSAADWMQFLEDGRIFCNGARGNTTTLVARGDLVQCNLPDFAPAEVNFNYEVVYEDDWLLGINKPAGLRVHSMGKFVNANLIYHVRHLRQPPCPQADLVNRLDADTSGLVLLGRDKCVLSRLAGQFAWGTVDKRYLAVVNGQPDPADGTINLPIGPVKDARVPRFGIDLAEGKPAVTHYATLRQLGEAFTLLELRPASGRTHQLRVHLAAIGHPIAGDALYTMNDADYLDWRRNPPPQTTLSRQALHSHELRFLHPIHQIDCILKAPLAADIAQFMRTIVGS